LAEDGTGSTVERSCRLLASVCGDHEAGPDVIAAAVAEVLDAMDAEPSVVHDRFPDGSTALGLAAQVLTHDHAIPRRDHGEPVLGLVRRLVEAGADPGAANDDGWTPLHTAGMGGHRELARVLIDAGGAVSPPAFGIVSATPLAFALFYCHREVARLLIDAGGAPDDLRTRAALGDVEAMERWLADRLPLPEGAGAGFDFAGPPQWFPPRSDPVTDQTVLDESLSWAARNGQIEAMARLVDAGADVNANPYRGTPLLWAVYADAIEAAEWLLDHGADPDLRHDFGGADHGHQAVAMHLAAQFGSLACLRLLLDRGADPSVVDARYNGTPLGWALHNDSAEAVEILRSHGAP
jgi:ankyrin repeat protein